MSALPGTDALRRALAGCVFPPATSAKRFVRNVNEVPIEKVTEAQRDYLTQLAWKFRRQMPHDLVPTQAELLAIADKQRARKRAAEQKRLNGPRAMIISEADRQPVLVFSIG